MFITLMSERSQEVDSPEVRIKEEKRCARIVHVVVLLECRALKLSKSL